MPLSFIGSGGGSSGVAALEGQVLASDYGVVGDGVADDSGAIQDAIDAAVATQQKLVVLPPGKCKINSGLTVDLSKISLSGGGRGTMLDASGFTEGNAITIIGTSNNFDGASSFGNSLGVMEKIRLKGAKNSSTATSGDLDYIGIHIEGADPYDSARFTVRQCAISGFGIGINYGNNAYVTNFENTEVWNCLVGVYLAYGLTNAGERLKFEGMVIYECGVGAWNGSSGTDMFFTNSSFDFMTARTGITAGVPGNPSRTMLRASKGTIHAVGCHFEDVNDTDYWFSVGDPSSAIFLDSCRIYQGANKTNYEIGLSDQGSTLATQVYYGGIHLNNCFYHAENRTYGKLCIIGGTGRVSCRGWTFVAGAPFGITVPYPTISRYLNETEGNFDSSGELARWGPSGTAGFSIHTGANKRTGAGSLAVAAGSNSIFITRHNPKAGSVVLINFWHMITGLTSGEFRFALRFKDMINANISEIRLDYAANVASFTKREFIPQIVPKGTFYLTFDIISAGAAGGTMYVDDLVFNVIE